MIASLSIPWGFSKGDDDLGGYHLIWPRDLVETAAGFWRSVRIDEARRVLRYLQVTQEPDGHWTQNMWLDGTPYWHGIQMDETALPILLVDLAAREGVARRQRAGRLLADGAASRCVSRPQRPGEPAGSLGGRSRLLAVHDRRRNRRAAGRRRSGRRGRGDDRRGVSAGNGRRVERQHRAMAVCDGHRPGAAARRRRLLRARRGAGSGRRRIAVRRLRPDQEPASRISQRRAPPRSSASTRSPSCASDCARPTIRGCVNTVKVIDATLKVDTPRGPAWHRYQGDGYGEHADGGPFDGTGIGRAWPLLTGERAHYELAAGRTERGRAAGAGARGVRGRERPAARADLGHRRHSRARTVHRAGVRLGEAARVGARRVPQVVPIPSRRARVRSAAPDRAAVPRRQDDVTPHHLALQQQGAHDADRQHCSASRPSPRPSCIGARMAGGPCTIPPRATPRSASTSWTCRRRTSRAGARVDFTFYWPDANRWEGVDFVVCVE